MKVPDAKLQQLQSDAMRQGQTNEFVVRDTYHGLNSLEEKVYAQLLADYGQTTADEYRFSLRT